MATSALALTTKPPPTTNMSEVLSQLKSVYKKKTTYVKPQKLVAIRKAPQASSRAQSQLTKINSMAKANFSPRISPKVADSGFNL